MAYLPKAELKHTTSHQLSVSLAACPSPVLPHRALPPRPYLFLVSQLSLHACKLCGSLQCMPLLPCLRCRQSLCSAFTSSTRPSSITSGPQAQVHNTDQASICFTQSLAVARQHQHCEACCRQRLCSTRPSSVRSTEQEHSTDQASTCSDTKRCGRPAGTQHEKTHPTM